MGIKIISKKIDLNKHQRANIALEVVKANLSAKRIISQDKNAISLYDRSRFGELFNGKVIYSLVEALYLSDKKKIAIYQDNKKINYEKLLQIFEKIEKNFWPKFCVFKDMRDKGYIVKTALKFGADFMVYEKGVKPGQDHSKWILYPVFETKGLTWHEFSAKNRVAHSTKKNLLIGIVDEKGEVTYYEIKWLKP